jgi:hypothetical protein
MRHQPRRPQLRVSHVADHEFGDFRYAFPKRARPYPLDKSPDHGGREQYSLGGKRFSQKFRIAADFKQWWPF